MIRLTKRQTNPPGGFLPDGRRRMEHRYERHERCDEGFTVGGARGAAAGPRLQPPPPRSYALIDAPLTEPLAA